MSIPQIVEVAVGLVVVYYVLGLIVSFLSNRVTETLGTRGTNLEKYLKQAVGETKLGDLTALPQISSLAPIRYNRWWGIFSGDVIQKKVEKIPVANLVDAVFDLYGLAGKEYTGAQLQAVVSKLPDAELKKHLEALVNKGVTDINQLRSKVTMWTTGFMDQVGDAYKANARRIVIGLSVLVTLAFGVDSIELTGQLWQNSEMRAIANAQADAYIQKQGAEADLAPLIKNLDALALRIGWWSAPSALPKSATPLAWVIWVLKKIVGLGITACAVSQGSSFWYDILSKIKGENAPPSKSESPGGDESRDK